MLEEYISARIMVAIDDLRGWRFVLSSRSNLLSASARHDIIVVTLISVPCSVLALYIYLQLLPHLSHWHSYNYWFDADTPLILRNFTNRDVTHPINAHHPIVLAIVYPAVSLITVFLGISAYKALGVLIGILAAVWIVLLYSIQRLIGISRVAATLFTLLGAVSASAICFGPIPETLLLGSVSLLLAMITVAVYERTGVRSGVWHVLASALTLGVTVTHWAGGLIMLFSDYRWKRALRLALLSFLLVVAGSVLQSFLYSSVTLLRSPIEGTETRFVFHTDAGGPLRVTAVFFSHAVVAPEIVLSSRRTVSTSGWKAGGRSTHMSVQHSPLGSGSRSGAIATTLWLALLSLGAMGALGAARRSRTMRAILLLVVAQYLLHLVFGVETFFYSLAWTPLLIIIAAMGTRTRYRIPALVAVIVLLVTASVNNVGMFYDAVASLYGSH